MPSKEKTQTTALSISSSTTEGAVKRRWISFTTERNHCRSETPLGTSSTTGKDFPGTYGKRKHSMLPYGQAELPCTSPWQLLVPLLKNSALHCSHSPPPGSELTLSHKETNIQQTVTPHAAAQVFSTVILIRLMTRKLPTLNVFLHQ